MRTVREFGPFDLNATLLSELTQSCMRSSQRGVPLAECWIDGTFRPYQSLINLYLRECAA